MPLVLVASKPLLSLLGRFDGRPWIMKLGSPWAGWCGASRRCRSGFPGRLGPWSRRVRSSNLGFQCPPRVELAGIRTGKKHKFNINVDVDFTSKDIRRTCSSLSRVTYVEGNLPILSVDSVPCSKRMDMCTEEYIDTWLAMRLHRAGIANRSKYRIRPSLSR